MSTSKSTLLGDTKDTFVTQRAQVTEEVPFFAEGEKQVGSTYNIQSTMLLQKKRVDSEVTEELKRMKDQYTKRIQMCKEREDILQEKQKTFLEDVKKYEAFLREADGKRLKSEQRAASEVREREEAIVRLSQFTEEQEGFKHDKEAMALRREQLKKFKTFLESVLEVDDKFHADDGVEAILRRYETLVENHARLRERISKATVEMEEVKKQTEISKKTLQNEFLIDSSRITEYQSVLEELRQDMGSIHGETHNRRTEARDRQQRLGAILMAIQNLYRRAVDRAKEGGAVVRIVTEERAMLDFVELEIEKLQFVLTRFTKTAPSTALATRGH